MASARHAPRAHHHRLLLHLHHLHHHRRRHSPRPAPHHWAQVFHTNPNILHYRNLEPGTMEVGHVFTIEPMICEGTAKHLMWDDAWTATTRDGLRSAQFEHTLLITPDGVEPLTARLPTSNRFFWEADDFTPPEPSATDFVPPAAPDKAAIPAIGAPPKAATEKGFGGAGGGAAKKKAKKKKKR